MIDLTNEEIDDRINKARSWLIEAVVALDIRRKEEPLKEAKAEIEKAIKLIGQ